MTAHDDLLDQSLEALCSGNLEQASRLAAKVLESRPDEADAHLVLATQAMGRGNADLAARHCAAAREAGGNGGWLLSLEGRLALEKGQMDIGREKARAAAVAGAPDAHVANEIGVLLVRTGMHQPSLAYFRFAAQQMPGRADLQYNYATSLQATGDVAAAKAAFRRATQINPDLESAWLGLAKLEDDPDEEWIAFLQSAFGKTGNSEKKLVLGHAISRMYEARGDWPASLDWLDKAKLQEAQVCGYSRAETQRAFASACKAAEVKVSPQLADEDNILFVAGLPRSGTTLVQRILDSHAGLNSRGELLDWPVALRAGMGLDGRRTLDAELIDSSAAAKDLTGVGEAYLESVLGAARHNGAKVPHIIDKAPLNILHAPAILRALPGARVICLRRSPFDSLFGIYRQLFAAGFDDYRFSLDFADTAHVVASFNQMADCFAKALPQDRFLTVHYEDVVADLEGQARRLIAFTGLEWDPACVDFHSNPRPTATASSAQVRQPIYSGAIGRWRRYGAGADRAEAELAQYGIVPEGALS